MAYIGLKVVYDLDGCWYMGIYRSIGVDVSLLNGIPGRRFVIPLPGEIWI